MNKERQIERFIHRSVKKGSPFLGETDLRSLLEIMTTDEITMFWFRYSASRAFTETNSNVPDWKTKQQLNYLKATSFGYAFTPKEKDKEGRYIIHKMELVDHVVLHISNIIDEEIMSQIAFKNKSYFEKIPFYTLVSSLLMIPIFFICSFFPNNKYCKGVLVACCILYGINFITYVLVRTILNRRNNGQ